MHKPTGAVIDTRPVINQFIEPGCFRFLNLMHTVDDESLLPALWQYQLHYHEWLFDLTDGHIDYIHDWIRKYPAFSSIAWDSYPISLRLVNWIKVFARYNLEPDIVIRDSISTQFDVLLHRLEFDIDGNHLLENLLAAYIVVLHMDSTEKRYMQTSVRIRTLLSIELESQFLADGGHYERAPMYHATLMGRMLDVLALMPGSDEYEINELLRKCVRRGLEWLNTMSINDKWFPFNDASYDGAPTTSCLLGYARNVIPEWIPLEEVPRLCELRPTGYIIVRMKSYTIVFDVGAFGPEHQPGHAHCDMLSYCLYLADGTPIIIDSGNYGYAPGTLRDYCRSTRAHNTVSLDGSEQAEIWASHRMGRRGRVTGVYLSDMGQEVVIRARHDCFRYKPGSPEVERTLTLTDTSVTVHDRVISKRSYHGISYLHPASDLFFKPQKRGGRTLVSTSPTCTVSIVSNTEFNTTTGWSCPEFGIKIPCTVFEYPFSDKCSYTINII